MENVSTFNKWHIEETPKQAITVPKNPWKSDAPCSYPYVVNAKNSIYHVLNYDEWTHFTNYQVIELFRVSCKEEFFKTRAWQQLYGFLCIEPEQTIRIKTIIKEDIKYIYECIYQMSFNEIHSFLKNLKILVLSVILRTKCQLSQMQPPPSSTVNQVRSRLLQSNKKSTNTATVTNLSDITITPKKEHIIANNAEQGNLFKRPHNHVSNSPNIQVTIKGTNCTTISNAQSLTPRQEPPKSYTCVSNNESEGISKAPKKQRLSLGDTSMSTLENNMTVDRQASGRNMSSSGSAPFEINEMGDIVLYI